MQPAKVLFVFAHCWLLLFYFQSLLVGYPVNEDGIDNSKHRADKSHQDVVLETPVTVPRQNKAPEKHTDEAGQYQKK